MKDDVELYLSLNPHNENIEKAVKDIIEQSFGGYILDVDVNYNGEKLTIYYVGDPAYSASIRHTLNRVFDL